MKPIRLFSRAALAAGILGALALSVGPLATSAEAHRRHKQKVVRHHHRVHYDSGPVVVHRVIRHRPVIVREYRPWYVTARRVYIYDDPFYFHTGLNVFFGGGYLDLRFGNYAPAGYIYYDPYCDREFASVDLYHRHLNRHDHEPALQVIRGGVRFDD